MLVKTTWLSVALRMVEQKRGMQNPMLSAMERCMSRQIVPVLFDNCYTSHKYAN